MRLYVRAVVGVSLAALLVSCGAKPGEKHADGHAAPAHGQSLGAGHGAVPGPAEAHAAVPAHGAAPHQVSAHWSYSDQRAWVRSGDACAVGQEQSPINLPSASPVSETADLGPRYIQTAGSFFNNGHTLQFAPAQNNLMLTIGHEAYTLVQFHFHSPAEHTLDRRAYPVEVHFVHKNSLGQLAVLGVFVEEGPRNEALAALIEGLPRGQGDAHATRVTLDPTALLPVDRAYFAYAGSLTTPPCTEGVRWNVLRTPMTASADQIAALREALGASSRHIQPINGRTLLLGI